MISVALAILFFCIFGMLIGILNGKNLPERIMSLCCLNNYIIVFICFLSLFEGRESFIDIAYIYALLGFVVNLGLSKLNGKKYD